MKKLLLSGLIAASSLMALAVPPTVHESALPDAPRTPIIAREDPKAPTMPVPEYMKESLDFLRRERDGRKTPGRMLAPMSSSAYDIYGYLWWSNNLANIPGIYILEDPIGSRLFPDYSYDMYNYKKLNGWYLEEENAFAGVNINMDIDAGLVMGYSYYTVNLSTGGTSNKDYLMTPFMFQKCTYSPELERVYGYLGNLSSSQEEYYWAYAPVDNIAETTILSDKLGFEDYCYALYYSTYDGNFYGVNGKNQFVNINRTTGEQTVLLDLNTVVDSNLRFDTGDGGTYWAGLVWNDGDNCFYFNAPFRDKSSNIPSSTVIAISADASGKYTAKTVMELPDAMNFSFFFTKVDGATEDQPAAPLAGKASFEGASLTGDVTFYLPRTNGAGQYYPEGTTMEWTATLDGEVYGTGGTGTPGQEVVVAYTVPDPGIHVFGMYVTADGARSPRGYKTVYIGNDTPSQPKNVFLNNQTLTWDAVTTGVNSGYIDVAAMEYEITLNGEVVGTTKETSYNVTSLLPSDGPLQGYDATVTAVCNGLRSAAGESNHFVWGEPYYCTEDNPYYIQPTEEQWRQMTAIDANGDKRVYEHLNNWTLGAWTFNDYGGYDGGVNEALQIHSSSNNDDYLYLPPVELEETTNYYKVSFHCAGEGDYFDMYAVKTPSPYATKYPILENYTPRSGTAPGVNAYWDYIEAYLHVPDPGIYYICIQAKGNGDLRINRLSMEPSKVNGNSPRELDILMLSPGAEGKNIAAVTMLPNPNKMNGSKFPEGDEIYAVITVNGKPATYNGNEVGPVALDPNIKSGQNPVSQWVDTEQSGYRNGSYFQYEENKIEVQVYDVIDGVQNWGPVSRGEVYTGYDFPATPEGTTGEVLGNYSSALLKWQPVTRGATGGTIDPEEVYYSTFLFQQPTENVMYWLPLQEDGEYIYETEYVFNLLETYNFMDDISFADAPQDWYSIGAQSNNGAGSTFKVSYVDLIMGKPYDLPYEDDFSDPTSVYGNTTQMWVPIAVLDGVTRIGTWSRGTLSEGFALLGRCNGSGSGAILIPPFSTKGHESATINMSVRTGSNAPSFQLLYEEPLTYNYTVIGSYEAKEGPAEFETLSFQIPEEYLGLDAVKIYIVPTYTSSSQQFWMNNISVTDGAGVDSALAGNVTIAGSNGCIVLKGCAGEDVNIWSIDGMLINRMKAEAATTIIPANKGVYVVKVGDKKAKVVVK